jgi:hypothetical protein
MPAKTKKNTKKQQSLQSFEIPKGFWEKLYEFTGSTEDNRGFLLAMVNHENKPVIVSRVSNEIVFLGLHKFMQEYTNQMPDLVVNDGKED